MGVSARLGRGLARAAKAAAQRDRCEVAGILLAMAGTNVQAAVGRGRGGRARPAAALRVLDAAGEAADAAKAVIECRERARAAREVTREPTGGE